MTYLDVWRSGTFLLYGCKVAFCIQETSPRLSDVKCSVILQSLFAIGSALTCLLFFRECATLPQVKVHFMWLTDNDSYTRPSHTLVLQAKNARMRRLGYDGTKTFLLVAESKILRTTVNTVPANSMLSSVNNRARYPVWNVESTHLGTQLTVEDTGSMVLNTVTSQKTTRSTLILSFSHLLHPVI